jgi:hypothetical protein
MGEAFLDSATVVPLFLSRLTTSNALIGLGSALAEMGWSLPQFLVLPAVARHRRLLWLYRRAAVARGGALVLLTAALFLFPALPPVSALVLFFACYGAYCFGAGTAALPFFEVVSKTVPAGRLAAFFAQRLFWGGLLAGAAGLIVRHILRDPGDPSRWALTFGLGALLVSVAYALFLRIHEPPGEPGRTADTPLGALREGLGWLRQQPEFRRLLGARVTLTVWLTASPFVMLFAVRELGGGGRVAGTFLFARVAGFVLANLLWQRVARRHGTLAVLRAGTLGCSVLAFVAAALAALSPWSLGWLPAGAVVVALETVMFCGGAAHSGILMAFASLLIELAPGGRRRAFVSLMNSFLGAANLLPMFGGAIVDALDAPVLFALCGLGAILGVRAARRLAPPGGRSGDDGVAALPAGPEAG